MYFLFGLCILVDTWVGRMLWLEIGQVILSLVKQLSGYLKWNWLLQ